MLLKYCICYLLLVTFAASTIFLYWWFVPSLIYSVLWWRGNKAGYTLTELLCVYGYSLFVYIPISVKIKIIIIIYIYKTPYFGDSVDKQSLHNTARVWRRFMFGLSNKLGSQIFLKFEYHDCECLRSGFYEA